MLCLYRRGGRCQPSLNLVQGHASQEGGLITVRAVRERWRESGGHARACACGRWLHYSEWRSPSASIQWNSCGHLKPACADVSARLPKPAPFIILQQPRSNWAASPSVVTHHLLHIESEEIQMYLVRDSPVAAYQAPHLNCICGQLSHRQQLWADPKHWSFLSSLAVPACRSVLCCGSPVMMSPISWTGEEATMLQGSSHRRTSLFPPIFLGY